MHSYEWFERLTNETSVQRTFVRGPESLNIPRVLRIPDEFNEFTLKNVTGSCTEILAHFEAQEASCFLGGTNRGLEDNPGFVE